MNQHDRDSAELRRLCQERDTLRAEIERLEQWKKEALGVLAPVLDYAHGLKVTQLGQSVTQALIDDHMRLHAAHQQELERHRTTWTQLEQAKAVINELMESCEYWGEYDVPVGIVERMRAVLEAGQ